MPDLIRHLVDKKHVTRFRLFDRNDRIAVFQRSLICTDYFRSSIFISGIETVPRAFSFCRKKGKVWVVFMHLTMPAIGIKYITIGYD